MNDPPGELELYRVSYSRVRESAKQLLVRARQLGMGVRARASIDEIDRRLHIYPQFGQPLRDAASGQAQLWIGVVAPLVVHYIINEARREVLIVLPIMALPHSGL